MSAGQELSGDLVAVACVVEASLLLASEWSRVLIKYVVPLLERLKELHPSHQLRLAFVTYGAADKQSLPSKIYFAPLAEVTKALGEEPSGLGIGQTNSSRGLSALEGLVAAIELFDILMASANFNVNHAPTQSPQKDNRSFVAHLLHIAASPPDNAKRPLCNTLQHLDSVNWESIPAELRKRKIKLSLISLRKVQQFQDLQSSVAGPDAQSPWFNVHSPHVLLLSGFPTPPKTGTKRQPDILVSDQSPDAKRHKVVADPVSKTASPTPPPARIPPNQRPQQPMTSQAVQPPPASILGPNPSPAQPVQAPASVPASTPATASPSAPPPPPHSGPSIPTNEVLDQEIAQTGFKFSQMVERFRMLERDLANLDAKIANAQRTGQTAILVKLQQERAMKNSIREKIQLLLRQHYQKMHHAQGTPNVQAGTAGSVASDALAEAGTSTQPAPPLNVPNTSSERPTGSATDGHKLPVSDTQILTQFWHSRGGTVSAANNANPHAGPSQPQPPSSLAPEAVTQTPTLLEKSVVRPLSQALGPTPQETGATPSGTNNQVPQPLNTTAWLGTFTGTFPRPGGQGTTELQVHVAGVPTASIQTEIHRMEIRTDLWPRNLTLKFCKEPVRENAELSSWLRRHQGRNRVMQFRPNPRAPEAMNEQKFQALNRFMAEKRIFAYAGWQLPTGRFSYNIFIFPMSSSFAGAVFPDGLPDLPGSGNMLEVQPPVGGARPQPSSGISFPPALLARIQSLEPAKQKQVIAYFVQEQLRRQQLQQAQQAHVGSSQVVNPPGMSIPPNPYSAVASIPAGLHPNINPPSNPSLYNAGGGTVSSEMLQSFVQRNVEGSTSQGMNPGSMP